jgi:hypothetical protein
MEAFEEKFKVKIRGTRPMLQHRYVVKDESQKSRKAGTIYDHQKDAEEAVYKDDKGCLCVPSDHILGVLIKAASRFLVEGSGKKTYKELIRGGVIIEPVMIPLKFPEWKLDLQRVVVSRASVTRARPRFDKWEIVFTIINIEEKLTSQQLKDILETGGKHYGIGDARPRFGTFEITSFEKIGS